MTPTVYHAELVTPEFHINIKLNIQDAKDHARCALKIPESQQHEIRTLLFAARCDIKRLVRYNPGVGQEENTLATRNPGAHEEGWYEYTNRSNDRRPIPY